MLRAQALVALALVAGGCAHHARLAGDTVIGPQTRYRIGPLPRGWTRVDGAGDVAFHHAGRGAIILASSVCGKERDAPLQVLANTLLMGFGTTRFEGQALVRLDGREALRTRARATLDGVPVHLDALVLKKDGCIYDLVLAAPPGRAAEGEPDFERFVAGFATLPHG
jgi:hypothetical protein